MMYSDANAFKNGTAMIILHFHLQLQCKYELFHIGESLFTLFASLT